MEGSIRTSMLLILIAFHVSNAFEAKKVLHIPEKIIGGVIDMVQSHKNKPAQQTAYQGQGQQQTQQTYGWNSGIQSQNQAQAQYGNYGYPQTGQNYPQGGYLNAGQGSGYQQFGGSQVQNQGQYQNYQQIPPNNQYQIQNQQTFDNQFQNQVQNGFHNQQSQVQMQNQNQNFQGNFVSQPQNTVTGSYGNNQQGHNYLGQGQSSHNYGVSSYPQGQVSQSTFVGQNQQLQNPTTAQVGSGPSYGSNQNFQASNGQPGAPGPTCVCQAWPKPINGLNNIPSQRNEEKSEKIE